MIAGKLGKMKGIRKFNYDAGKFDEEKDVSHPYINFFWDRSQQVIIIEKNSSVFPEIDKLITSIEAHFNNILTSYELTVKLVPLTEMYDFWKVMTEYEAVFEVRFELFMPNFLGRTNEAVKEFLTTFQADYNTSSLNITFKNAEGYLQIPTNNTAVIKILDWIAKGGGTWAAIVKKSFSKYGKKSTILSAQNIVYNEVTQDSDLRSEEDVKPVLQKMRPKYAVGNGGDEGNSE